MILQHASCFWLEKHTLEVLGATSARRWRTFGGALRSTAPFDSALFVNNLPTRHRQLYLPPSNHTLHNPLQPVPKAHRFLTRNRPNPTTPLNRSSPRIPPPTIQLAASEGTFQDTSRADSAGAMNETIHSPSLEDTTSPNPSAVIIDPTSPQPTDQPDLGPLVQHVVIRRDLLEGMKWPVGSVVAQGCHAAVAAIWQHQSDPLVQRYCGDLDRMHKVVLEVKGEAQLAKLAAKLEEGGIHFKLWIEQPEGIPTCLATKPYYKSHVGVHFKSLKLFK